MRKHLLASVCIAAVGLTGVSAMADGRYRPDGDSQNDWKIYVYKSKHATVDQETYRSDATDRGQLRRNRIKDSNQNLQGISHDQQNNGNQNAIGAATTVIVNGSDGSHYDDLDQNNYVRGVAAKNNVEDDVARGPVGRAYIENYDARRTNRIDSSYNNALGIIVVQQNNGDANVMGVSNAVAANIDGNSTDDNKSATRVFSGVYFNRTEDEGAAPYLGYFGIVGERDNLVTNSFVGSAGIATVQQNNGSSNVMGVANTVIADIDSKDNDSYSEDSRASVSVFGGVAKNTTIAETGPQIRRTADRSNLIDDGSFRRFEGIANVQQNNGDANAISAGTGVRASINSDDVDDIDNMGVEAAGYSIDNHTKPYRSRSREFGDNDTNRVNTLHEKVFNNAQGIINVQQNNGDGNSMNVANGVYALFSEEDRNADDARVGAFTRATVEYNSARVSDDVDRVNRIDDSFNGVSGILNVQQNNGDHNVMNAANAVAVHSDPDGQGFSGDVMTDAAVSAVVSGNYTYVAANRLPPAAANSITGAFNNFKGIKTVQQNNGHANAIQSSISVVASIPSAGGQ